MRELKVHKDHKELQEARVFKEAKAKLVTLVLKDQPVQ